ncbi:MAG: hypothetical protein KA757_10090 [Vogesella sp.]|nr:hypothetical protein [Vogesella sp.]
MRKLWQRLWHDPATRWPLQVLIVLLLLMLAVWLFDLDAPVGYQLPLPVKGSVAA